MSAVGSGSFLLVLLSFVLLSLLPSDLSELGETPSMLSGFGREELETVEVFNLVLLSNATLERESVALIVEEVAPLMVDGCSAVVIIDCTESAV